MLNDEDIDYMNKWIKLDEKKMFLKLKDGKQIYKTEI